MLAHALLLATALCASGGAEPSKPVLMVLYFDNNTGQADYDVLRKGLADMLVTDLVAWDGVTVVEREKLEAVLAELSLQKTRSFDQATAAKVGKLVGAEYLLTGSFGAAGSELRMDARLVSASRSTIAATASVRGDKDEVFDLEQQLVDRLTAGIDLRIKNDAGRRKAKVPSLEALLAYSAAVELVDQGEMEKAQEAISKLVSQSPGFAMAREKKKRILEQLAETAKQRSSLEAQAMLRLGKAADEALAADFASLDKEAQQRFLGMRLVKGRLLIRLLAQHLSHRDSSVSVVLRGHEAQALALMRAWAENQRRLTREYHLFERQHADRSPDEDLEPEIEALLRDAKIDDVDLEEPVLALVSFVVEGHYHDDSLIVGPALGDFDPGEQKAAFELLEETTRAELEAYRGAPLTAKEAIEIDATWLLQAKAEALETLGRDEEAIAAYQRILDQFPTSSSADSFEREIKILIDVERDHWRDCRSKWLKALAEGCADSMDVSVGLDWVVTARLRRMGLDGLAAVASELEKACKLTPKTRRAFSILYEDLALNAALHEDCESLRTWARRHAEATGSTGEIGLIQRSDAPGCSLDGIEESIVWMNVRLDDGSTIGFDRQLTSRTYSDGRLCFDGSKEMGSVGFCLEPAGEGAFSCKWASFSNPKGSGTRSCSVTFTSLAAGSCGFDQGTFTAEFDQSKEPEAPRRITGDFRVYRE